MACKRLTYQEDYPSIKVVHRSTEILSNSCTGYYMYGFQGQEKDDEVSGSGNTINFKYRSYDPRIGRFKSIDPLSRQYPFYSPYAFSGNRVIDAYELEGLEPIVMNGTLVGYRVQAGQGPTQISGDINNPKTQEKYGYNLHRKVNWKEIVQANEEKFPESQKLKDNQDINDKGFNTNGNIQEGDNLNLPFVKVEEDKLNELNNQLSTSNSQLDNLNSAVESLESTNESLKGRVQQLDDEFYTGNSPGDPVTGHRIANIVQKAYLNRQVRKNERKINRLNNKSESGKSFNKKIKGNIERIKTKGS